MRTKTLLLTAALSAAGMATSMAQVYSVNAVGYVNTTLVPGFNLVSNPLKSTETGGNQVKNLFASVPNNSSVYLWTGAGFDIVVKDADLGWDEPGGSREIVPGGGAFVRIPGTASVTITFVGEVDQGNNLSVPLNVGFNLVSSRVPQEGTAEQLAFVPKNNDALYFWSEPNQRYDLRVFDSELGWDAPLPVIPVGDAFFVNTRTAGSWTRSFNVNS